MNPIDEDKAETKLRPSSLPTKSKFPSQFANFIFLPLFDTLDYIKPQLAIILLVTSKLIRVGKGGAKLAQQDGILNFIGIKEIIIEERFVVKLGLCDYG